jgi:hypothetical protein
MLLDKIFEKTVIRPKIITKATRFSNQFGNNLFTKAILFDMFLNSFIRNHIITAKTNGISIDSK